MLCEKRPPQRLSLVLQRRSYPQEVRWELHRKREAIEYNIVEVFPEPQVHERRRQPWLSERQAIPLPLSLNLSALENILRLDKKG